MTSYVEAHDVAEAVAALARGARPIAGGTDLVVGARHGKAPLPGSLVGIHRIPGLAQITEADGVIRIGSLVSHADILRSELLAARAPGLLDASAIVGSQATRANGTLGGNVMNASPAMDTGAPLLCLGALAVLTGPTGTRRVPLDELWTGPGRTSAAAEELLEAIELPAPPAGSGSSYVRLQYRRQMEIAVVGAAAQLVLDEAGTVTDAKVAISALTPVIQRVPAAESALVGQIPGDDQIQAAGEAAAAAATPISDVRASAAYRRAMAAVITRRAVAAALTRASGGQVSIPASDWSTQR